MRVDGAVSEGKPALKPSENPSIFPPPGERRVRDRAAPGAAHPARSSVGAPASLLRWLFDLPNPAK
jgi:hypothetical protein